MSFSSSSSSRHNIRFSDESDCSMAPYCEWGRDCTGIHSFSGFAGEGDLPSDGFKDGDETVDQPPTRSKGGDALSDEGASGDGGGAQKTEPSGDDAWKTKPLPSLVSSGDGDGAQETDPLSSPSSCNDALKTESLSSPSESSPVPSPVPSPSLSDVSSDGDISSKF